MEALMGTRGAGVVAVTLKADALGMCADDNPLWRAP